MNRTSQPAAPRFLWTGLMILIPVMALGAVGLWQLRQDRVAALAKAQTDLEDELARTIAMGKRLPVRESEGHDAIFSTTGKVLWPKPIPMVPVPNIATNPHAEKLKEILSSPRMSLTEQAHALHDLSSLGDLGTSAAGFSVRQLALRNALRFGKEAKLERAKLRDWADALTKEAIERPSILSEKLILEASELEGGENPELARWNRAQRSRRFLSENLSLVERLIAPGDESAFSKWLGPDSEIFGYFQRERDQFVLDLFARDELKQRVEKELETISLPQHLAHRFWLGERLICGDPDAEILARLDDDWIRAEVVFTDRDAFFQPVRERSIRTAWLIALAILAAGIGWFAAWRAFLRQQQLATMKDNFVSAVSHELKAPIASIGLMAEELGAGSDKRADYTRLIVGECARLGSLVENVLDYARIESGHDGFNFEEADLGELIKAAAELMLPPAAERGIRIEVDAPLSGELCASIDARALGRALVNLLDNAIKYAPPKSVINLAAEGQRITISDQGPPIPTSEREKIFARFYRSGSELTRETKGVGIGLSLVRHLAHAHDGKVWLESDSSGNHFIFQIGKEHFNSSPDA